MRRQISDWLLRRRAQELKKPEPPRRFAFVWDLIERVVRALTT